MLIPPLSLVHHIAVINHSNTGSPSACACRLEFAVSYASGIRMYMLTDVNKSVTCVLVKFGA